MLTEEQARERRAMTEEPRCWNDLAKENERLRSVNAKLVEALEAHRAWGYCEDHAVGTFDARMALCSHAQSLTLQALAIVKGEPAPDYEGTASMIVWPHVARNETPREQGAALVIEALEHERTAIAAAEGDA